MNKRSKKLTVIPSTQDAMSPFSETRAIAASTRHWSTSNCRTCMTDMSIQSLFICWISWIILFLVAPLRSRCVQGCSVHQQQSRERLSCCTMHQQLLRSSAQRTLFEICEKVTKTDAREGVQKPPNTSCCSSRRDMCSFFITV